MKSRIVSLIIIVFLLQIIAVAQDTTLTVVTHDSFNVSQEVLQAFEAETGITVEILRLGDAGQMVNQSILSRSNPLGDVLYGVDNTFLGRALDAELFIPYESSLLDNVSDEFILDSEFNVTPINYGDVCLNYDKAYFEENELAIPESLADLTDEAYRNLLVVENPATSSPGLAFLLATIGEFGTEGDYTYLDYWSELVDNEILITSGWSDAYFGAFTAGSEDGTYPLVVSYASSPPFTVNDDETESATGSVVADGTCFRQIEFAGILSGTEKVEEAQHFIDFMLSVPFQEDVPFQMFVFPVNEEAELPELFAEFADIPENPAVLSPEEIDAGREQWIEAWTEQVLR